MELLNPAALLGLLALPALLLPYLVRRKPRRQIFSSLLLLVDAADRPSRRSWGAIRLPWVFFLQLGLLLLLILALGEPVFLVRPTRVAIILDTSASMQTLENGRSRFALAQEKARSLAAEVGLNGEVDLYITAPRLEKLGAAPLSSVAAAKAIDAIEAYDVGESPVDYHLALHQLAQTHKYERIFLLTDRPARGESGVVRIVTIGQPKANFALTGFHVHRASLNSAKLEASIEAANFSSKDERLRVAIKGSGNQLIARRELLVPAGKRSSTRFDGITGHPYYQAEIEPADAFLLDNRRFAIAPQSPNLRILGISPRPKELTSLTVIPGLQIDIITPQEYGQREHADYGLEIFHFSAPAVLPARPALLILPAQNNPLVDLQAPVSNIGIATWREPHGLTRYVNFSLFRLTYARALNPRIVGERILESPQGLLAFAVERQGTRYLALGFDPFPYLGRENLPMSIFTLNFLDWFATRGPSGQATGEPIPLGTIRPGDVIVTPKGFKLPLKSGHDYFSGTLFQGIYHRYRGNLLEITARNLEDSGESDLRAVASIELRGDAAPATGTSVMFSFWPYLLFAALALLLIEWFSSPRRLAGSGFKAAVR